MTANVWVRGMLQEEYGVKPRDIKWRRGGLEEAGREERTKIKLPADIELQAVPKDRTLSDMLAKGEIDGLFSARAPSCFRDGAPNVARLFPNYPAVEEAYYRKTKLFPIMHAIGIRKSLVEKHPWLAVSVYKAFLEGQGASACTSSGRSGICTSRCPGRCTSTSGCKKVMGEDYWSYGAHENKHALETLMRYSFEQGLAPRKDSGGGDVRQVDVRIVEDLAVRHSGTARSAGAGIDTPGGGVMDVRVRSLRSRPGMTRLPFFFDHFPHPLGDSGSTRGSTPSDDSAFATALAITPPTGMMPPSPAPLAPSGLCGAGCSSSAIARISGKSAARRQQIVGERAGEELAVLVVDRIAPAARRRAPARSRRCTGRAASAD